MCSLLTISFAKSLSSQGSWLPDDNNDDGHESKDCTRDTWIVVRSVDREQLPGDVEHHVEKCHGEDAFNTWLRQKNV